MRHSANLAFFPVCVILGWAVVAISEPAGAATIVFQQGLDGYSGTSDTFLSQSSSSSSFGASVLVEWDGEDGGGVNTGLLRFDDIFGSGAGQIPSGAIVNSATLTYYVTNSGNSADVNEVAIDWDPSVTYNGFGAVAGVQPEDYGDLVGSASGSSGAQTLNVTDSVTAWSADPSANKGWIFRPSGTDGVEFLSSENAATGDRPKLTVDYTLTTQVEIMPDLLNVVVGIQDQQVTVNIPPGSNDSEDVDVILETSNAAVANPVGASNGVLTVTFLQGASTQQMISIDIGDAGAATVTTTNTAGLADDTLTVSVSSGEVGFSPTGYSAPEGTTVPLAVMISSGSNDTRDINVTVTTNDPAIALPDGAAVDSRTLTFLQGDPTYQIISLHLGNSGDTTVVSTNDGGLTNATIPVHVAQEFRFTVTADPRDETARWNSLLAAINTNCGDHGAFHVSCGDIDPIPPIRTLIDTHLGPQAWWYPGIGNHEEETAVDMDWLRTEYHTGHDVRLPLKYITNQDGPASTVETTYSWDYGNAHFVMLNEYWNGTSDTGTDGDIVPALYNWLAADLAANTRPVVFIFGHEPAYPFHRHVGDSLDKYPANRDAFWNLLEDYGVAAYICGHTHVYKRYQPNPGGTWQIDAGNAGNDSSDYPDTQTFVDVTVTATQVTYAVWKSTTIGGGTYELYDTWSELIGPKLNVIPQSFTHDINGGDSLPDDSFEISLGGVGSVSYTITDNADWLAVAPDAGSVSDETDTIVISYPGASSLSAGPHAAQIEIVSDAVNSPNYVDVTVNVAGPRIVLNPTLIEHTVFLGDNLSPESFTVSNGGGDTLVYTISEAVDWLDVSPLGGDSTGEPDPIDLTYDVDELPVGLHAGVVSVDSLDAENPHEELAVQVTVVTVKPDFDGDGDVDQTDFGHLQACLTGSGVGGVPVECADADLNGDEDVDLNDFGLFQMCISGEKVPADRACDDSFE